MRSYEFPLAVLPCLLLTLAPLQEVDAQSKSPRVRSFRPVVPIKQMVSSGSDQLKNQTVKVMIPPPPIPSTADVSGPDLDEVESPSLTSDSSDSTLPPEPSRETESSNIEKVEEEKELGASKTPSSAPEKPKQTGPTLSLLRQEAHLLASKKLNYVFGADNPDKGSLDCSSTIQYLLTKIGIKGVPRTSYDQYYWLKRKKLLDDVYGKSASSKLLKKLAPGDLIFWGGTWKSGHRVSHVMLYMGYDPAKDKHYVFGARSKTAKGLTGSGVDIFELNTESGRLIAHGKIPGLIYD